MSPAASRVRRNFSRGASSYDAAASFQSSVAGSLAAMLSAELHGRHGEPLKILELGCGTGLLSSRILKLLPSASLLASDLSPEMLEVCGAKLSNDIKLGRLNLLPHDFEEPLPGGAGPFDIAISSLAFQWSSDLKALSARIKACLKPGGSLFVSLPLDGSLAEIYAAFERCGERFPGLPLPEEKLLREALSASFGSISMDIRIFEDGVMPLRDCLRRFGELGTVNPGRPLPVGSLRKVLARAGDDPAAMRYKVALCHCR